MSVQPTDTSSLTSDSHTDSEEEEIGVVPASNSVSRAARYRDHHWTSHAGVDTPRPHRPYTRRSEDHPSTRLGVLSTSLREGDISASIPPEAYGRTMTESGAVRIALVSFIPRSNPDARTIDSPDVLPLFDDIPFIVNVTGLYENSLVSDVVKLTSVVGISDFVTAFVDDTKLQFTIPSSSLIPEFPTILADLRYNTLKLAWNHYMAQRFPNREIDIPDTGVLRASFLPPDDVPDVDPVSVIERTITELLDSNQPADNEIREHQRLVNLKEGACTAAIEWWNGTVSALEAQSSTTNSSEPFCRILGPDTRVEEQDPVDTNV